MSVGHAIPGFHFDAEGLPNAEDWIEATRLRRQEWEIRRGFTIPYCAGWDAKERIVYVDELVPESWTKGGRTLIVVERPLFWHESGESDTCRDYPDEHYPGGHTIGTYLEHIDVRIQGFDPLEYEHEFWAPIIKACAARKSFPRMPKGCSLVPYFDSGADDLVKRMTFV